MNSSFKIFFFFLLLITLNGFGQKINLSDNCRVSVITCDTGNESYSLFGHTAIRILDPNQNMDLVYNYGAFDFGTPNFVAKFAKGDLQYFAVVNRFVDFIGIYTYEQRSVYEQELLISTALKQQLFDNLNTVLASDKKYYTYKFIDKNCTSMVVDMLNKTLGNIIIFKKTATDISYRSILFPYFDNSFYQQLGTSIIFGKKVDETGNTIFLPLDLQKSLSEIQFENHPLCKESNSLLEFKKTNTSTWWDSIYVYIIILGTILFVNKNSINNAFFLLLGILGLFFSFMGFYSLHGELAYNYNILLFNPALLILLYCIANKNKKWVINTSYLNLLCLLIYLIILINKAHFFIMIPLIITSGVILIKTIVKNSKRIPFLY